MASAIRGFPEGGQAKWTARGRAAKAGWLPGWSKLIDKNQQMKYC
jgi:hypothetical protein